MNGEWLNKIVKCPRCNNDVKDGNRIWLNGECLCLSCYILKRMELDNENSTRE